MGAVNLKSTQITNRDATPAVLSSPATKDGMVRSSVAKVTMGSADSGTSTYKFMSIPSNARITGMSLTTDTTAGGSCAIKLGVYDTTANGGAIVGSGDQFGTSIDLHTAALTRSNQMFHSGAASLTVANAEKMLWDALALSSDPNKEYDITATLTADNSSNAVVMILQVDYVI
jgi:hypothetical protein